MKDITDKNFKSNNSEFMRNNSEFMRNKEKQQQIDEIAECVLGGTIDYRLEVAELIYNKGYRKQSVGEWYRHDKKKHGDTCYYCSACGKMALSDCMVWELTDYCPHCGAKMKGEQ